jgi:hypothetical protein
MSAGAHFLVRFPQWQRRTNVWREVTSPARGLRRLTEVKSQNRVDPYGARRDSATGSRAGWRTGDREYVWPLFLHSASRC